MLFPELVGGSNSINLLGGGSGNIMGLKYPDLSWLGKVHWLYAFPEGSGPKLLIEDEEGDPNSTEENLRPTKKIKLTSSVSSNRGNGSNLLPSITTLSFSENSTIVSEISTMKHFAISLVKLELPSQLASSLENGLVRLALFLESDGDEKIGKEERLSNWLRSKLEDEIGVKLPVVNLDNEDDDEEDDNSFSSSELRGNLARQRATFQLPERSNASVKRIDHLLNRCRLFFYQEGRLSGGLQNWLYGFLKVWNGTQYVKSICGLIGLVEVRSWKGECGNQSEIYNNVERS